MSSSTLQSTIGEIGTFLSSAAAQPNAPASVKTALADLETAVHSVEAAVPDAIEQFLNAGVNALLEKVPGFGALAEPEVDALVDAAVQPLLAMLAAKLGITLPGAGAATATASPSDAAVKSNLISELNTGQG